MFLKLRQSLLPASAGRTSTSSRRHGHMHTAWNKCSMHVTMHGARTRNAAQTQHACHNAMSQCMSQRYVRTWNIQAGVQRRHAYTHSATDVSIRPSRSSRTCCSSPRRWRCGCGTEATISTDTFIVSSLLLGRERKHIVHSTWLQVRSWQQVTMDMRRRGRSTCRCSMIHGITMKFHSGRGRLGEHEHLPAFGVLGCRQLVRGP